LVWGLIPNNQTPNWASIGNAQTPNWQRIAA